MLSNERKLSNLALIRHLKDRDLLTGAYNDAPLELDQEEIVHYNAQKILDRMNDSGLNKLEIITSPKKRTVQTATMFMDFFNYHSVHPIQVRVNTDPRTSELYQGKYILPSGYKEGDYFPPLQQAWDSYFSEAFNTSAPNLSYRFGDPINKKGNTRYPELVGHFKEFGENQLEFSIRYLSFLTDLAHKISLNPDTQFAIVGHQAILARLLEYYSVIETVSAADKRKHWMVYWTSFTL